MGYMEKLAAEKKAVKALYDKGMENLTDDEANELKNHYAEAKRLQERVDLFKGVNDLNVDEAKPQAKAAPAVKTLGDLYAQELKKAGLTVIGTERHESRRIDNQHGGHRLRAGGHAGRHGRRLAV